jgi:hypothetical protein
MYRPRGDCDARRGQPHFEPQPRPLLPHFYTMHKPGIIDKLATGSLRRPPAPAEGSILESEEIRGRWRVGRQRTSGDTMKNEIAQLRVWKERYTRKYTAAKERIAELEDKIEDISKAHRVATRKQDQRIRAVEDELARTKELLAARSTELSGAQSFLSTTDGISEAEVLNLVRDLNENIFQVAANLTEEWEIYKPSKDSKITKEDVDPFSDLYGPALICHVLEKDPAAVTFLLQSCLCDLTTQITSSWRRDHDDDFGYVYQRLYTSGGYTSRATTEIRLTHPRGTSNLSQMEVLDPQPPS